MNGERSSGLCRGRAKLLVLILVVAVLAAGLILFWDDLFGLGHVPEYARAAAPDCLVFAELTGDWDRWFPEVADSRFVSDGFRDELREFLEAVEVQERNQVPAFTGFLSFGGGAGVCRAALIAVDVEYDDEPFEVDDVRFVQVIEFPDGDARQEAIRAFSEPPYDSERGPKTRRVGDAILLVGESERDLRRVARRLEGEGEDSLAGTDAMEDAAAANRGDGLFGFFNGREYWDRSLRQMRRGVRGRGGRGQLFGRADFGDLADALSELVPVASVGGSGLWLGEEESRIVFAFDEAPLFGSGLFDEGKGEDLFDLLPDSTMVFGRVSLFDDPPGELLDALEDSCSDFGDLLDMARGALEDEWRGRIDVDRAEERLISFLGELTGGFAYGWVNLGGGRDAHVFLAEVSDRDDALAAFDDLLDEVERDGRLAAEEVKLAGTPAFRMEDHAILAFHDEAVILFVPEHRQETEDSDLFLEYLARCEDDPLSGTRAVEDAAAGDVDPDDTVFGGIHPYGIAEFDQQRGKRYRERYPRDREEGPDRPGARSILRRPRPSRPEELDFWAPDEWIGISAKIDGDGLRLLSNFGYGDLMALGLTGLAQRAVYAQRCLDAIDTRALIRVIREAQANGERIRNEWDLRDHLDRDSLDVLSVVRFRVEDGGTLVLRGPVPGEETRLPIR